jgi:hypothetical protein
VKDLLEHQASEIKRQVENQLRELKTQRREALREGDHVLADELEDQIDETKERLAEAGKVKKPAEPEKPMVVNGIPVPEEVQPWAVEFGKENEEWLGKDRAKTGMFMGLCEDIFATTSLRGRELLDEGKRRMEAALGQKSRAASKTDGGSGGWEGSASSGGKGVSGYSSLPADAKAACDAQERKFVGEGKLFKSTAEWRTYYTKTYNESTRN